MLHVLSLVGKDFAHARCNVPCISKSVSFFRMRSHGDAPNPKKLIRQIITQEKNVRYRQSGRAQITLSSNTHI